MSGDLLGAAVGTVHLHLRTGALHVILQNQSEEKRGKKKKVENETRHNVKKPDPEGGCLMMRSALAKWICVYSCYSCVYSAQTGPPL